MKDLLTIRELEHNGIKILLRVDRKRKTISLVEAINNQYTPYTNKQWVFGDRTVDYAKSWLTILDAIKQAVDHGIEELEALDDELDERIACHRKCHGPMRQPDTPLYCGKCVKDKS